MNYPFGTPSDQYLYDVANKCYNWVKANGKNLGGKSGSILVAVMYVPDTKLIYAAAIPRGDTKDLIVQDRANAPAWNAQVGVWWAPGADQSQSGFPFFHAEDRVFFHFETSGGVVTNNQYPVGSVLAVYGKMMLLLMLLLMLLML
jgi:hypothetical protein